MDLRSDEQKKIDPSPPGWNSSKIDQILDSLRELVYMMAKPVINTKLACDMNKKFPNFRFGGGRRIMTMQCLIDCIYDYGTESSPSVSKDELRAIVFYGLYCAWGTNVWAEQGERQIMELLGFRYDGNKLCGGGMKKRQHNGGCIKQHMVKKLDGLRCLVLKAWEQMFHETLYSRDSFKPKPQPQLGDDPTKKRKPDKSHLRKYIRCQMLHPNHKVNYILLEGHPEREAMDARNAESIDLLMSANLTPAAPATAPPPAIAPPPPSAFAPPPPSIAVPVAPPATRDWEKECRELQAKLDAAMKASQSFGIGGTNIGISRNSINSN